MGIDSDYQWATSEPSNLSPRSYPSPEILWKEIAGDVKPNIAVGGYQSFHEGYYLFYKCYASIPDSLSRIAFYIIRLRDVGYISGIRLISSQGTLSCLDYLSQEEVVLDATILQGFNLAVGLRGIQAVQTVNGEKIVSQWVGCPDECPKIQFLAVSRPVRALEAGFGVRESHSILIPDDVLLETDLFDVRGLKWSV